MASNNKNARGKAQEVFQELISFYKGDECIPELFLAGIFSRSKTLLEGAHGKGKSYIAELTATITGASYCRVQGSQGLTESKYLASLDVPELMKGNQKVVWQRFVKSQLKLFDELNRAHPVNLNSLFEMLAEGHIDYAGERFICPDYSFIATLNPADAGTYEVPPPLIDRFDICLPVRSVGYADKVELLDSRLNGTIPQPDRILEDGDLEAIWSEVEKVKVGDEQVKQLARVERTLQVCRHGDKEYLTNFPSSCENCRYKEGVCSVIETRCPASERPALSVIKVSKGLAYLRGRNQVQDKDIKDVIPYVFYHRLILLPGFQQGKATKQLAIAEIFKKIYHQETERGKALELIEQAHSGKVEIVKALEDIKQWTDNDMVLEEVAEGAVKTLKGAVTKFKRSIANLSIKKLEELIRNKTLEAAQKALVEDKLKQKLAVTVDYHSLEANWSRFQGSAILLSQGLTKELRNYEEPPKSISIEGDLTSELDFEAGEYVFHPTSTATQKKLKNLLDSCKIKVLDKQPAKDTKQEADDGETDDDVDGDDSD